MLMKFCPKCRTLIMQGNSYCDKCKVIVDKERAEHKAISKAKSSKKYNKLSRNTKHVSFYRSSAWKTLRAVKLSQSSYMCEDCKAKGVVTIAADVHHITPISEAWDKRLNIDNLKCLCVSCHNKAHDRWGNSKTVNAAKTINKNIKVTYE